MSALYTIWFDTWDNPNSKSWLKIEVDTYYRGIEGAQEVWDKLQVSFVMKCARP